MLRVCRICKSPIYDRHGKFFCYHCGEFRKESQLFQDDFCQFVTEYLKQEEFDSADIENMLMAVEYLMEILSLLIERHGSLTIELQKSKNRLDWYRSVTTKLMD